jgi:NAD(P)H-dependent FMN reductase
MSRLLIVHHTTSPATQELLEAALAGTSDDDLTDVNVVVRPALTAGPVDLLAADGVVLGTPANIGYMAGALKHFFDTIFYPCLQATHDLPYGLYVHGNNDTTGAIRSVTTIAQALTWREVSRPVAITGPPAPADLAAVTNMAATVSAHALGLVP